MSTSYQKQSGRKKKDEGIPASDLLGVPTPSATPSSSSSVVNVHGDKAKKGFRTSIRSLFSSGKEKKPQEATIVAEDIGAPKEHDTTDIVEDTSQHGLQSKRLDADLTEDPNHQWQLKAIDYSMEVMSLFEELSGLVALVVPDALGMALRTITAILQRLKQMIENNQAWKDLLMSIDDRQRVFNEQLGRVQPHELPPKLMSAMKKYAQALEKLAARVMEQAGLIVNGAPEDGRIAKIKAFMNRAYNAESDAGAIEEYKAELNLAINEVQTSLTIYTAVTVNRIDKKADNLKALIFLEGNSAAEKIPLGTKHKHCLENTRVDVLEDICRWKKTEDVEEKPVYCIGDVAGTGKSTIAYTMAEEWSTGQCFSFFFSNTSTQTSHTLCISLAKQIIGSCYGVDWDEYWATLSSELSSPVSQTTENLWEKLVFQPLAKCVDHQCHFAVVDALDECDLESRAALLKCLLNACSSKTEPRLRLLLTTRKEDDISEMFDHDIYHDLISHRSLLDSTTARADIAKYVEYRMSRWTGTQLTLEQRDHLTDRCGGLFIFASLACGLLESGLPKNRLHRLQAILGDFTSLDSLYHQTLLQADGSEEDMRELLKNILGVILVAWEPLSISALAGLLLESNEDIRMLIKRLGSILGSGADDQPIHILHATLKEFLLRETLMEKIKDPNTGRERADKIENEYYIREPESHLAVLNGCLSIMSTQLMFNVCRLETSCLLNDQVVDMQSRIRRYISDGLRYSCVRWANHLESTIFDPNLIAKIRNFMENYFLYWLEVLSVTKCVGFASRMLKALTEWMMIHNKDDVMAMEMGKFVTTFTSLITQSAAHIYLSALPFTPPNSIVSKYYLKLYPHTMKILRGGFNDWPNSQNVLFGHTDAVISVAFSPNGLHIASGSRDETIRLWSVETGEAIGEAFKGHAGDVNSVVFSPDGKKIVSGSGDKTIRVWDVETGEAVGAPFQGHKRLVTSVAFSPDGKRIVSGSYDKTVHVWDAETGREVGAHFNGHDMWVSSVAFSPDGKRIVSGSGDGTIRIWDAETGEAKTIRVCDAETGELVGTLFEGINSSINSVAFSPDGIKIVSGSNDKTIRVWDVETGEAVGEPFEGHDKPVNSVAFSPDGMRVLSGSGDDTIRLWDADTGEMVGTPFKGHDDWVHSVAFSPDGKIILSGSYDKTVRLWDAESGEEAGTPYKDHDDRVSSVASSPDGKRIASGSWDGSIQIWDAETGEAVGIPFKSHEEVVGSIAFSPDGKRIVSGYQDNAIQLWDAEIGEAVGALFSGHKQVVFSVAFSPNGKIIASGSRDTTIRLWSAETGEAVGEAFKGHAGDVNSVVFSPDGKKIVSGSDDKTIRVWDVETGEAVGKPFEGHSNWVQSVAFAPDGKRIVSGSRDGTVRIWDVETVEPKAIWIWDVETGGTVVEPFKAHDKSVNSVAFSPDGKKVLSGSIDKMIRLWDVETGEAVGTPFKGHNGSIDSVMFSPDGKRVISASGDNTIRVWDFQRIQLPSFTFGSSITNGWMVNSSFELLFWVPPQLRAGFPTGGAIFTIGKMHTPFPDFTTFVYGEKWTRCRG